MSTSREVITLHFGQAGIQIGDAIWQTMAGEHNITPQGELLTELNSYEEAGVHLFFHQGPHNEYIPRTLMVDSEPTVIDEIRTGYFRKLFHPDLMISGVEDAANNYGRGYYSIGQKMIYTLINQCRYMVETYDNLQGFMSYTATGGGTGSGLFSMFLERAMTEYSSKMFIGTVIVPGKTLSNCVVDPYNTIFKLSRTFESEDLNFILDNESLYSICKDLDIQRPTYHNINKVLSPLFSTITAPIRFGGPLTGTINEISTNLIPYPRINFPTMSYAPFLTDSASLHGMQSCNELTNNLFDQRNNLLNQNLSKGFFMSSVLIYRGSYNTNEIITSLYSLKAQKKCRWVDWCPTGFKITHTSCPALHTFAANVAQPPRSILMLCNHTAVMHNFDQESKKFHLLFQKKCYCHWYVSEGMEEEEFRNAIDDMIKITNDYEYICVSNKDDMSYVQSDEFLSTDDQKDEEEYEDHDDRGVIKVDSYKTAENDREEEEEEEDEESKYDNSYEEVNKEMEMMELKKKELKDKMKHEIYNLEDEEERERKRKKEEMLLQQECSKTMEGEENFENDDVVEVKHSSPDKEDSEGEFDAIVPETEAFTNLSNYYCM